MCKTRQEAEAEANLTRQGFTVYLPMAPSGGRKSGRIVTDVKAMFPGYLFVEADIERQDLSVIRSTLGCIALLRYGVSPAIVPTQIMDSIKEAEDLLRGTFEINQGYTPGAKYELLERGFHGHTATFLALDGRERARVLIGLLNTEHEVSIPKASLGQQVS
jgi:transcriptional antiterminator RfaH